MKNKKYLFFITDEYPYGYGEPFIENEIEYLSKEFEKIYILTITKGINQSFIRPVPLNVEVINMKLNIFNIFKIIKERQILKSFIRELIKTKKIRNVVSYQVREIQIREKISEVIKLKNYEKSKITLYSYWFNFGAYAISNLKKLNNIEFKAISRGHGYDMFKWRELQLFKPNILEGLDELLCACKFSRNYCREEYGFLDKIGYSYLGVKENRKEKILNDIPILLSCSNIIPLKRIHLIIEAISLIKEPKFKWIHIGDGTEKITLEKLSKEKLKSINYEFLGQKSNSEVIQFYKENYIKCFITTSQTEGGVPVSIMEAQSFGIPVIGTNVGGIGEIINNKTGVLLDEKCVPEVVAKAIVKIMNLSEYEFKKYNKESYENWKEKFNAEKNYINFIKNYLKDIRK